ncbi:probable E3 ubiquitin-protein ligase HERC6 isoform X1 [Alligator mississippiensis]|uniref:probable E3 ubiquitin-protein ligase HERC6 isoform X1 n=1 Tax=Alligator mississippiensis TaxID=8496 RepID=UPI0009076A0F|nr:probable E3 ubiquitin-protein ligase HERC6 isoform X1 [Alligator mississippiensis]
MSRCWGAGSCGQLGLGLGPAAVAVSCRPGPALLEAACGERHTLLLRPGGTVWACGDNARGQLGRRPPPARSYAPEQVQALEAQIITRVSCGKEHSLAVSNEGKVFSWGAGSEGQLGTGEFEEQSFIPKKIDGLSNHRVLQVTCGHYHSLALTQDGRVFSWGQNGHGQLGLGKEFPSQAIPQQVVSLNGIPLAQVAAGGAHSFALSLSGVVYGWGRNSARQLGLSQANTKEQVFKPWSVAALKSIGVIYIGCGDEHTAVLTQDGSVFTFGDNSAGQLGHHFSAVKTGPQKVEGIDGPVSHLACGSYHTLVYVSASGQLMSFGCGPQRPAENETANSQGEQVQNVDISSLVSANDLPGIGVKMIFAGAYVSFISTVQSQSPEHASGISSVDELPKISKIDRTQIEKWLGVTPTSNEWQEAKREIEEIFSSSACLSASFLKPRSAQGASPFDVDLQNARDVFDELTKMDWIANTISCCLRERLIPSLPLHSVHQEAISIFLLLPECPIMHAAENLESLVLPLAKAILSMSDRSSDLLEKCWLSLSASCLDNVVQLFKKAVVSQLKLYYTFPSCQNAKPLLEVLKKLHRANKKAKSTLQLSNFYIHEISSTVNLQEDVARWRRWQATADSAGDDNTLVTLCRFPFVFNLVSKIQVFRTDSVLLQQGAKVIAQNIIIQNQLLRNSDLPDLPIFPLEVNRNNLVEDTLRKLCLVEDSTLKKELMVAFKGEIGLDAGGVTLEFFLTLFEEMVHPEYGLFMYCETTSPMWFPTNPSIEKKKYYLFGILCGLALFNGVIAYIPFPLAVFKKLLDMKPSLEDLKELSPVVGKSMQAVLDDEHDDIEENLQLKFCMSTARNYHDISWDNKDIDLIPNGSSIAVTSKNKRDFINKYIDYIFNKSVEVVYEEFKRGFYKVLDKDIVRFFHPEELMEVTIGNTNYDWNKFEENAEYHGIYTPSHPTIKMFWEVFHDLLLEEKKGFLLFLTGSDRIPILGMNCIRIKFYFNGALSEDHFPQAQTCFQILFLPPYSDKEILKEKLLTALSNNRGFGK